MIFIQVRDKWVAKLKRSVDDYDEDENENEDD